MKEISGALNELMKMAESPEDTRVALISSKEEGILKSLGGAGKPLSGLPQVKQFFSGEGPGEVGSAGGEESANDGNGGNGGSSGSSDSSDSSGSGGGPSTSAEATDSQGFSESADFSDTSSSSSSSVASDIGSAIDDTLNDLVGGLGESMNESFGLEGNTGFGNDPFGDTGFGSGIGRENTGIGGGNAEVVGGRNAQTQDEVPEEPEEEEEEEEVDPIRDLFEQFLTMMGFSLGEPAGPETPQAQPTFSILPGLEGQQPFPATQQPVVDPPRPPIGIPTPVTSGGGNEGSGSISFQPLFAPLPSLTSRGRR